MWESLRRVGAGFVGVMVLLALGRQVVVSQQPAPSANPNVYVNPFATSGRFGNPTALGQALPGNSASRLGYGSVTPGSGASGSGYGTLAASYANPSLGYGSLTNSNNNNPYGNGGYGGYGYGIYGTQWMMNPYQGYLSGAADLTRANADWYQTISQAKLTRQEAIRSSIQTRRAMIEEAEWERAHMPDPEKIRQQALEREINRARNNPPDVDVWSARALNALLRHLIAQQGQLMSQQEKGGVRVPDVPLSEDTLDHIRVTVGDSRGNIGLLKNNKDNRNNVDLQWPLSLRRDMFKNGREEINSLMQTAYKSAKGGSKPDPATIRDLRHHYQKLKETLDGNVSQLTPDEYIEANRYLGYVDKTITALKSPNVVHFFDGSWDPTKAHNVAELVQFMREQGLWFAEARPTDYQAYRALYYALASFDRGMQRLPREGGLEGER
jgi:Spy/CpxP family protein refolding chaperone